MKTRTFAVLLALLLALGLTTVALALVGDLNIDGVVDDADMTIVTNAYGSRAVATPPSPNWDWRADINNDRQVNLSDLTIAGRNYGDTFNFHWPRRISNGRNQNPTLTNVIWKDAVADSRGHIHVIWLEDEGVSGNHSLYYTQLDAAGNTVVEDVRLDYDAGYPSLAVDAEDNVHIVWVHGDFSHTYCWYTKLDVKGRTVITPTRFAQDTCAAAAVATDAYGHPHMLHARFGRLWYTILDGRARPLVADVPMNTVITSAVSGESIAIAVDHLGNRHVLWYADTPGTAGDLVYTRLISGGLPSPNQITVTHISSWNPHRLFIRTDSQGAAHILWHDNKGDGPGAIYWRRINPDGSMTPERLVTTEAHAEAPLQIHFAIDASDRIHLVAEDEDADYTRYARLDRDGNTLVSFRHVAYASNNDPAIAVGPDGQAAVLYAPYSGPPNPLFVKSTVPDPTANDTSRADLVLDAAHLAASPRIARIIDTATVTATVFNGGWVTATNIVVTFTETVSNTPIPPATIAMLPPFSSTTVVCTFAIPDLEETSLLPIRVSAGTATPETTLTNNAVTTTLGIIPPAHHVDLGVAVFDETYAPNDRSLAAHLIGGQLRLQTFPPVNHTAQVTSTNAYNAFTGVPLNTANPPAMTTTMLITLTAPGFSTAAQVVTATRDVANPYRVHVTPPEIKLYVNQWGTIQGTVLSGTTPLSQTTVTLDTGAVTTTNASGVFTFTKVVSGNHTLEAIHAGNLPTTATVAVRTGETAAPSINMPPTTKGWVRGTVWNDWGQPFAGATVELWADGAKRAGTTTSDDGRYVLEIADVGVYASYQIRASASLCDPHASGTFSLTAGVPYPHDFTLNWTVTDASVRKSGDVVSWVQEESWNKPDYDGMPVGWLLEQAVQEIQDELGLYAYEVDVWWGKYHYDLGLNYSEAGGVKTVESLGVSLSNWALYSYDVQGGEYEAGVQDIARTNLRVDRVDLVEVDSAGNVTAGPYWYNATTWYANQPDGSATTRGYAINRQPAHWSNAAIRIFLRVGKYDPSSPDTSYWAPWMPPVAVASLNGSGSAAGADYQCLLWRLQSNSVEVIKSAPYYATAVTIGGLSVPEEPTSVETSAAVAPQASVIVSLTFPVAPPAYVGTPFAVDVSVSGATAKPVYGVEFDLRFNPAHLRVGSVQGAPDFRGPYGTRVVLTPTLSVINASGRLTDTAVVRLGASGGLAEGRLARITFTPLVSVTSTLLDLSDVWLADEHGRTYRPDFALDATLRIVNPKVYLPLVLRARP